MELHLEGRLESDSMIELAGTIRIRPEEGSEVLKVQGAARASCADADNDGIPGLTQLTFFAQSSRTHQDVPVSIAPILQLSGSDSIEVDIEENKIYSLEVTAGEERETLQARASYGERGGRGS